MLQLVMLAAIILFTWAFSWILRKVLVERKTVTELEKGRRLSFFKLLQYVIWVLAILVGLDSVGIKVTVLLAGSAALLVGIGLGLQEVFKDFICGIILLFDGTIRVSDVIEVEGVIGKVTEIRLRASEMETRDGIIMIIPNSRFITGSVSNWTHNNRLTRFKVEVGVAYQSDVEQVRNVLISCANQHPEVVQAPEPFVFFTDFAESRLVFSLHFFTRSVYRVEHVKSEIRYAIDKAFREHNISVPFPQREVRFIKH